jgi:hypothetical protein
VLQLQELQKIEETYTPIRVVQIEPGPIPTFTPSAPFSTRNNAASGVAILPTITSIWNLFLLLSTY